MLVRVAAVMSELVRLLYHRHVHGLWQPAGRLNWLYPGWGYSSIDLDTLDYSREASGRALKPYIPRTLQQYSAASSM